MPATFPDVEYLVFTVNKSLYGIPHGHVLSIVDMPETVTAVPHSSNDIRGMIDYRGENITVYDLRVCFGADGRTAETDELLENMGLRKQDHINWLNTLKHSVLNHEPITVQTNPHKCAFGLWYDSFESDNANLRAYMDRFDEPHKQIHNLAVVAEGMIKAGKEEEAKELVLSAENGVLKKLLNLFDGIEGVVRSYLLEYVVLIQIGALKYGLAVDDINFFSRLDSIEDALPASLGGRSEGNHLVQGLGRYQDEGSDVKESILLLELEHLVS
ncbi:MAG: chemotaxis protein CheW [Magnetococcales bacterium]|nr:chemotaxis protein CheW [Magnetococcales bacterium]